MSIKLIAVDMDGTLLNSKKEMPEDFIPWVEKHDEIQLVIASGRQYYRLEQQFAPIVDKLIFIADNGGLVFKNREIVYANAMKKADIMEILHQLAAFPNAVPILSGAKSAYMKKEETDDFRIAEADAREYYERLELVEDFADILEQDDIVKIAIFVHKREAEKVFHQLPSFGEHLLAVLSGVDWIDISNASVSKGDAIRILHEKYEITKEETMVFGDYLNDVTMFQESAESYAMANAHPKLKELAKYVAPSCDEEGVMQVIMEKFGE